MVKVLLDAFGTIFSPRLPIAVQYSQVAKTFGINLEPDQVQVAFRSAYKQWAKAQPLYGKFSGMTASLWWQGVIVDTFRGAGVSEAELTPVRDRLTTTLIERFWSREGYELHADVLLFLESLSTLSARHPDLRVSANPGVVSGSDLGCVKVLESLGVIATTTSGPGIVQDEIWTTWELEHDKTKAAFWQRVMTRLNESALARGESPLHPGDVLVVGDELTSDYHAPRSIGMRSVLLQRSTAQQHANAGYDGGNLDGIHIIDSLSQVPELITMKRDPR